MDNPVRSSLAGPHARFAQRRGNVLRYPADVSPFFALPDQPADADWADLPTLAGPGAPVALAGVRMPPPAGWQVTLILEGVQLIDVEVDVAAGTAAEADLHTERLSPRDVPDMLDLAERTKPGPFLHAVADNTAAISLYAALGFRPRREMLFSVVRVPAD